MTQRRFCGTLRELRAARLQLRETFFFESREMRYPEILRPFPYHDRNHSHHSHGHDSDRDAVEKE